jgi:hypothetical protein
MTLLLGARGNICRAGLSAFAEATADRRKVSPAFGCPERTALPDSATCSSNSERYFQNEFTNPPSHQPANGFGPLHACSSDETTAAQYSALTLL